MEQEETKTKKSGFGFKMFIFLLVVLLLAGGYGAAYYFYSQYKQAKIVLDNPQVASQKEVEEITSKLGKIFQLPEGEEPTVATVLDKEKLKDQPFFAKAENQDKVIIYTKSQLAILYRLSENKIINVAPVTLQQPEATTGETNVSPLPKATQAPVQE